MTGIGARPLTFVRAWTDLRPDTFDVIQTDLDGDGSLEIVIATLDAVGNGMGVPHWTVFALTPGRYDWIIDSVHVQEYSSVGSWVALRKDKRCNLLLTQWVNGYEAGREGGLYFQASWQAFEFGRFVQRVDRPIIRRRYLFSFERERSDSAVRGPPWAWLRSTITSSPSVARRLPDRR